MLKPENSEKRRDERVKLLWNFDDWRNFVDFQRDVKFTWPHHGLILACFFHKVFHPQRKKGRKSRNEFIDFFALVDVHGVILKF